MAAISYLSATDLATETIRRRIQQTPLLPGSRIDPAALASEFGLSRTPVRDALTRLQNEGLVEVIPRVGIFVRRIETNEVLEIYAIKEALEPVLAQWATQRGTLSARESFAASIGRLRDLAEAHDVNAYVDLVVERRLELIRMAQAPVIDNILRSIDGRVRTLRAQNLAQKSRIWASLEEHADIAAAVVAGDRDLAYERTKRHVQSARASLIKLLDIPVVV